MLILAAVAISFIIGNNGLFKKTSSSKNIYEVERVRVVVELVFLEKEMDEESANQI